MTSRTTEKTATDAKDVSAPKVTRGRKPAAAKKTATRKTASAKKTSSDKADAAKTSKPRPAKPKRAKSSAYFDEAIAKAREIAGDKLAYIIGDGNPYLYMALSDGSLNLRIYRYTVEVADDGSETTRWVPGRKYASSISHAMTICESDAEKDFPRRRKTDNIIVGTDAVIEAVEDMRDCLAHIANLVEFPKK